MRFNRCVALFATAVAVCTFSVVLALPEDVRAADSKPTAQAPCSCSNGGSQGTARPKFADLQADLQADLKDGIGDDEEIAALEAIRVALTEVGDGTAFVWRHRNGRIGGVVKPTSSFRDAGGRVCRHIVVVLAAGSRAGKIEGVACRLDNGRWELDG
jgi:surface antigen